MITKITAKNLSSWEDLDYTIPLGISQITGWNHDEGSSEGSGKSSIFNILSWVLSGKIPKESKVDEFVRDDLGSGKGQVFFSDGSSILRSRKPNGLYLVSLEGKKKKVTQEEVNRKFGRSFDIFCQSVYFSQDYPKKFIKADEETKAKVFTELQNLGAFDRASKRADARSKEKSEESNLKREELKFKSEEKKELTSEISWLKKQINSFESEKIKQIKEINERLRELKEELGSKKEIKPLESKIQKIKLELKQLTDSSFELEKIKSHNREATARNKNINSILKENKNKITDLKKLLETSDPELCQECGQGIGVDSHNLWKDKQKRLIQVLEDSSKEEASALEILVPVSEVNSFQTEEESLEDLLEETEESLRESIELNAKFENKVYRISEIKEERKKEKGKQPVELNKKLNDQESKLSKTEERYSLLFDEVSVLDREVLQLNSLKKGFKKVKIFVFKSALKELSKLANKFAQALFSTPVEISFTSVEGSRGSRGSSKIETQVSVNGKTRSLGLYSGGQFQRLVIATDLALNQIEESRSTNPLNLRILDEPLKNLSSQSKKRVMDLLATLRGSTVLIEHDEVTKTVVENKFHVDYQNGVSSHAG